MADHFWLQNGENFKVVVFALLPHKVFDTNTSKSNFEMETVKNVVFKLISIHYQFNVIILL